MGDDTQGKGLVTRLTAFLKQPFQADMGIGSWILFTILIVSIAVLWCRVLAHIEPVELTE